MWEQYRKTFRGMQMAIWLAAGAAFFVTHSCFVAAVFFATMQIGAIFGAAWGVRLKRILGGSGRRGLLRRPLARYRD